MEVNADEDNVDATENTENTENIFSAIWEKGGLACCFYKLQTMELFVANEAADAPPEHPFLQNILRQTKPSHIVGSGQPQFLRELMKWCDLPATLEPDDFLLGKPGRAPLSNFVVFPHSEKTLTKNRDRILTLRVPGMCETLTKEERCFFLESLLPLDHSLTVQCLGNLLHFLDMQWRLFFLQDSSEVTVTDVKIFFLESQVLVDDSTLCSLEIFSNEHHPSAYKQEDRQGFSVFSALNRCSSKAGAKALHNLLSQPTRDMTELNRSFETVQWFVQNNKSPTIGKFKKYLRKIHDLGQIFRNLTLKPNSPKEWVRFQETTWAAFMITNLCREVGQGQAGTLLAEIADYLVGNPVLKNVLFTVDTVFDQGESLSQRKFVVKTDLDEELDEKKAKMMEIQDSLQEKIIAECANLPSFVTQMQGYYIPEIGYVIKVSVTETEKELMLSGIGSQSLNFLVKCGSDYFYDSALCKELNRRYGNIYPDICEHEMRICQRTLKYLRENLPIIQKVVSLCVKLDYLMAFAVVARGRNLVRPEVVAEKLIKIDNGRHFLWEMKINRFVPNNTHISLENRNLITILTAPNASGKSVYMRQVALIAFLAHVGSFVPASCAKICLLDSIYSRMHSPESTFTGTSSFLADLQQMGRVMSNSTKRSLVLVDEFGKGTNVPEGLALLASCIEELSLRGADSPLALITTHYTDICEILKVKENILQQTFENKTSKEGTLVSTFRVMGGPSILSYATKVDGIKQFLDELLREKSTRKLQDQHREIHRLRLKFAYNAVKKFVTMGTVNWDEVRKIFEEIKLNETDVLCNAAGTTY